MAAGAWSVDIIFFMGFSSYQLSSLRWLVSFGLLDIWGRMTEDRRQRAEDRGQILAELSYRLPSFHKVKLYALRSLTFLIPIFSFRHPDIDLSNWSFNFLAACYHHSIYHNHISFALDLLISLACLLSSSVISSPSSVICPLTSVIGSLPSE